jgi:antitoxin (DNA-binding transcriptional repressor) of toxin-antitoxin stability system
MQKVDTNEVPGDLDACPKKAEAGEAIPVTGDGTVAARLSPVRYSRADAKSRLAELRTRARVIDVITPLDWSS